MTQTYILHQDHTYPPETQRSSERPGSPPTLGPVRRGGVRRVHRLKLGGDAAGSRQGQSPIRLSGGGPRPGRRWWRPY
eukprot:gene10913-biopygen18346